MATEMLGYLLRSGAAISAGTLVVLLLRRSLRQWLGARVAYSLWLLVPVAALAMLAPAPSRQFLVPVVTPAWTRIPHALANAMSPADGTDASSILLALWALGAAGAAFVFACRQAGFNRRILRRKGQPFDEVVEHGPAVTGILRPRIVLPTDFRQRYDDHEQALVLAHERVHLRRGDVQAHTLATALRCVFWFNPLLHFAATRFRFDQELACDAAVLAQFPSSRRSYGDAMLKTQMAESGFPIGCHWQSIHPLKERIAMLKQPIPTTLRRASGTLLVVTLVLAASLGAWAAQPAAGSHAAPPAAQAAGGSRAPYVDNKVAPGDTVPVPVDMGPPNYPKVALDKNLRGHVVLRLQVGADGNVITTKVERATPVGIFEHDAVEAAKKWKFHPATSHGKAIAAWVRVPVDFEPDLTVHGKKAG
jgi:TonB family protein